MESAAVQGKKQALRPPLRARTFSDVALQLLSAVVFLGGWELVVRLLDFPLTILPPPSRIVQALWGMIQVGTLPRHLSVTLTETLAGFVLGSVAGIALGTLVALSRLASRILYPYIVVLQVIPKVAIAPLLIIWFGFGIESKIVMAVLISFFPLLVNTIAGLNSIQPEYLHLMTALTASRWQTFRYVRFPSALPFIFAGLEAGIVLAIIGALVGEFVGAGVGLGYLVMLHNANMNVPGVFAVLVVLAFLGVALYATIGFARRRIVFWAASENEHFTSA
jgi:NitT/TauT family transport system permease protein